MNRPRFVAGPVACAAWLLFVVLWLTWSVLVATVWLLVSGRKRRRRKVAKAFVDFPSYFRIRDWIPGAPRRHQGRPRGRRLRPVRGRPEPRRMSSNEVAEKRGLLWYRDGPWCQECGLTLNLDVHHLEDAHPEVHHLRAWALHNHEPWVDDLLNLCLLCGPCNRSLGTGITPRLEVLAYRLLDTQQAG